MGVLSRRVALLGLIASLAVPVAATPAHATPRDCIILGPDYVAEVVDCAFFVVERAIQW